MQVVIRTELGLEDPTVRPVVESALADIAAGPDVAVVTSPYRPGGTVSTDGTAAIVTVVFDQSAKDIPPTSVETAQAVALAIADTGAQVELGGPAATAESGPSGSEVIGLMHGRAPARLRVALRHGRADRDGPVRPRLRPVGRGAVVRVDPDRDLRTGRRGDDRVGRGDRLRAADRDPAPGGDDHRPRAAGVDPDRGRHGRALGPGGGFHRDGRAAQPVRSGSRSYRRWAWPAPSLSPRRCSRPSPCCPRCWPCSEGTWTGCASASRASTTPTTMAAAGTGGPGASSVGPGPTWCPPPRSC